MNVASLSSRSSARAAKTEQTEKTVDWGIFFENWGIKTVTRNDSEKKAYVLNADQRQAVEAAGFLPAPDQNAPQLITLSVLLEPSRQSVVASYYLARRSKQAQRAAEARMGRQLIKEWLQPGDVLLVANIGSHLYALKADSLPAGGVGSERLASALPAEVIRARASAAAGPAQRRNVRCTEFVRNPYVVAAALLRAQGHCETPDCTHELFQRDDGTPYLEVHHLVPLASDGPDTLSNVAALCPSCHREIHHGVHGAQRTAAVLARIETMTAAAGAQP